MLTQRILIFLVMLFLIPLFLPVSAVHAEKKIVKNFSFENYDAAEEAEEKKENFLSFEMESTKLGLISSTFFGRVKKYDVEAKREGKVLKNLGLVFNADQMDTDIDSRNEKMWELCLEIKNYPQIKVKVLVDVLLSDDVVSATENEYKAVMNIRGKDHPIVIKMKAGWQKERIIISGESKVKLTELEIPSPDIAVASVRDEVVIRFRGELF